MTKLLLTGAGNDTVVTEASIPWYDPLDAGWSIVGAWQGLAAESLVSSRVNLPNPGTYDLVDFNTTPDWSAANGWSGFLTKSCCLLASGCYVNTTSQNWTLMLRFSGAATPSAYATCGYVGGGAIAIQPVGTVKNRVVHKNAVEFTTKITDGTLGIAGRQGYSNGVATGSLVSSGTGAVATLPFSIGGLYYAVNNAAFYYEGKVYLVALYPWTLTGDDMLALHTSMMSIGG